MTPPETQGQGNAAEAPARSPAVSLCVPETRQGVSMQTIAKRSDYLKAASARRHGTGGFLLQARDRADGDPTTRVGFTASKKIGNAVARNRAKRRLRALAREVLAPKAQPGWDYVLVARPEATVTRPYADLCTDLEQALTAVHKVRS
jgi:ribonuclease P protein component